MPSRTGTPDSTSELNAEDRELIDAATSVMARAYNPHSGWHVGAAVRTGDGQIFTGSFFEHATMGQTICAEPAAFIAANMAGHRDIVAIATVGAPGGENGDEPCTPCGRCRQTIHEFALRLGRPIRVLCANRSHSHLLITDSATLLPHAFSPPGAEGP